MQHNFSSRLTVVGVTFAWSSRGIDLAFEVAFFDNPAPIFRPVKLWVGVTDYDWFSLHASKTSVEEVNELFKVLEGSTSPLN